VILADPGRNSVSFLKRLREAAPALPALSIGGSLGDARLANSVPLSAPVYVQTAAWRGVSPAATAYVDRYEHRYGTPPVGYSDTLPYDAITVLVALAKGGERGVRRRSFRSRARGVRGRGGHLPVRRRPPGVLGNRPRGPAGDLRALGTRRRPDRLPSPLIPWRILFSRCSSTASSPGRRTP